MTATEHKRRKNKRKASEDLNDDKKRMLLEQEKINQYRNQNNINVVGRHVPEPAKTFEDFGVAEDIIENLKKCGYVEPTPIQKQAVPIMLQVSCIIIYENVFLDNLSVIFACKFLFHAPK